MSEAVIRIVENSDGDGMTVTVETDEDLTKLKFPIETSRARLVAEALAQRVRDLIEMDRDQLMALRLEQIRAR
jgi:hypothetical protein